MSTNRRVLLVIVVFAVIPVLWFLLIPKRGAAVFNDADLKLIRTEVSKEQNGFTRLDQVRGELYWPTNKIKAINQLADGKGWDAGLAEELLTGNARVLEAVDVVLNQGRMIVPEPEGRDEDRSYLSDWRTIGQLLSIQAEKDSREGRQRQAAETAFRIIHFGHLIEESGGPTIDWLVGSAIKRTGLKRLLQTASQAEESPEYFLECIHRLATIRANLPGLTNSFKLEYQLQLGNLAAIQAGSFGNTNSSAERFAARVGTPRLLDMEKSQAMLAQATRTALKCASKKYVEMPFHEFPRRNTNSPGWLTVLRGNAVGEVMIGLLDPVWEAVLAQKCREDVVVSSTQTLLALRAWHIRHGRLPDSLADLVPDYLPALPLDEFDGKPLRYLPGRKLLYSVGKDLRDDGGVEGKERKDPGDILLPIDF